MKITHGKLKDNVSRRQKGLRFLLYSNPTAIDKEQRRDFLLGFIGCSVQPGNRFAFS